MTRVWPVPLCWYCRSHGDSVEQPPAMTLPASTVYAVDVSKSWQTVETLIAGRNLSRGDLSCPFIVADYQIELA